MIATATSSLPAILSSADCWHRGWGGPWFLLFALFWAVVIVGIVWLIRGRSPWARRRYGGPRLQSAGELLDQRFARGEIDTEDYRLRRSILDEREQDDGREQG